MIGGERKGRSVSHDWWRSESQGTPRACQHGEECRVVGRVSLCTRIQPLLCCVYTAFIVSLSTKNQNLYLVQSVDLYLVQTDTRTYTFYMFIRWIRNWLANVPVVDWTNLDLKLLLPLINVCDSLLDQRGEGEDLD